MSRHRWAWPRAVLLTAPVLLSASALACAPRGSDSLDEPASPAAPSLGSIAYVNDTGCIAVVDPRDGEPLGAPYCPDTQGGVSAVSWLDADRIAYVTPETEQIGWRVYNTATGYDGTLASGEAPRVVHAGPVQPYSILGALLLVDTNGVVSVRTGGVDKRILEVPATENDRTVPQLLTWSPDGEWGLIEYARERKLLIVHRDGNRIVELASRSKGLASWFMPEAGATPHMDFACGLPTEATFLCVPGLREPTVSASDASVLLSWLECIGATGYELVISAAGSETPVIREVTAVAAYRVSAESLRDFAPGELTWKVRSLIGTSRGEWSAKGVIQFVPGSTQ